MANNSGGYIDIKIINDRQMLDLFNELQTKVQNKIVMGGMRKAAGIINQQAKQNLNAVKKGKSKNNYKDFNRAFRIEPVKNPANGFGVKVGVKYYKARWLEWGTADRYYKTGTKRALRKDPKADTSKMHYVGRIQPTHFFYNAVKARKAEAQNLISASVMQSMNNIVAKYENQKS